MKHLFLLITFLLTPFAVAAQTQEDEDRGYLVGLIEDNLSGVSRDIDIIGFEGALSSQATIEVLTIADAQGVWLRLEDIVLSWNRSALLRGAIDVRELSAARVIVSRPPVSEDTGPEPEATPFALPELPVSVSLDHLTIDRIELGEPFLGEPVALSLTGSAQLADGQGTANVVALRLGDKTGIFELNGSFNNESRVLDVLLNIEEGPDGIAARLLDLPGRPPISLSVAGNAPIDDFNATLALATDGQDRLSGEFSLTNQADGLRASVDLGGDVSPLFAPDYQDFFGDNAQLTAQFVRTADGAINVPVIDLDAGRATLQGSIRIGRQGWPQVIDLTGGIVASGDAPVLLPLSGPRTFVDGMDLAINYDGAVSDDWTIDVSVENLTRPGLRIAELSVDGGGIIRNGEETETGAVTADVSYAASGLELADAGASQAFGDRIGGMLRLSRIEDEVTEISEFSLQGAGLDVSVQGTVAGPDAGFETDATIDAQVAGLARFSTLIGQDIGGGASADITLAMTPLDGLFDIDLTAQTNDLTLGIPQADRLLQGGGTITANAVRDTDGTRLENLVVTTDAARLQASADLTNDGADADIVANLTDVGLVVDGLSGPASVTGSVSQGENGLITFDLDGTGPAAAFSTDGTVTDGGAGQRVNADLSAQIRDLSRYATLAGRPLSGAISLTASGEALTDGSQFDLSLSGQTDDLVTGIDRIDPLLAGAGTFAVDMARTGAETLRVSDVSVMTRAMSLQGDADLSLTGSNTADLAFVINDASLLDADLSGEIALTLDATPAPDGATQALVELRGPQTQASIDAVIASAANDREITGDIAAQIDSLGAYASLIGQPVAGSVDLTASGTVVPDLSRFETQVSLRSQDLQIGNDTVDDLLAGTGRINATVALDDGVLAVRTLEISTRELSFVGALNGASGFGQGRFNASLRDVGILTDQISGPVRATGSASLDDAGNWGIDATGTGPGGLSAQIAGQIGQDGNLAIDVDGSAPLALANPAIEPRRLSGLANFDISVNGPPALSSLGGQVTFSNGRLALPTLGQALTGIAGQIRIAGGSAQIDLSTGVEAGGSIAIDGPVALTGGNNANITVSLDEVVLQDPDLYRTTLSGAININGPLAGGARIAGQLGLGQTDIQVPSSSVSSLGELPEVEHVNASADARRTLARAGVLGGDSGNGANGGGGGNGRAFPLDIMINAPSRIFIRGRGLDAELGGRLTIGGTTANVVPVGRFTLQRGRIDILQQRFDLTEGVATLQGDFEPFIRLVATTETEGGTVINIIVEGPASAPEVRFESIPELPQDEVLARLLFGRDLQNISPLQAVQLASAISTLAGRGGGALDSFRENIGLDDFDVTTDDEGAAAVRAGKYLSENVYTDVTITSAGETEINLNLDITDEIRAKGSVDQDGESSIGVFFERDY